MVFCNYDTLGYLLIPHSMMTFAVVKYRVNKTVFQFSDVIFLTVGGHDTLHSQPLKSCIVLWHRKTWAFGATVSHKHFIILKHQVPSFLIETQNFITVSLIILYANIIVFYGNYDGN